MDDIAKHYLTLASRAGTPLPEHSNLRFAVGAFGDWQQLQKALSGARVSGLFLDSFYCLALERVLATNSDMALGQAAALVHPMPFPDSPERIACTAGPLAECLLERLRSGARSLKEALGRWLIPRHAAHFENMVLEGEILLWIGIADGDAERLAYQLLLAHSTNSVGVHDLVVPRE